METIVKESLIQHCYANDLLSSKQFGFLPGRSTITQLLTYLDTCSSRMANGEVTDAIYLDFAKAFDTVPHARLLIKLKAYGIEGPIFEWIKAFLTGRTQVVKVNGECSNAAPVLSGIPQGSVLGPLLFVLYINDLPDGILSNVLLFADDTKVFKQIDKESDSKILQRDLDYLDEWSAKWLLKFNLSKCHVLTLGKTENIKFTNRYSLGGLELEHVFCEKDLGVTIDNELQFSEHVAAKVAKANAIMGLIRRTFAFLDCELFRILYTTFVRPHLEYAQSAWSPRLQKYINQLERVQIRATKLVDGLSTLTYEENLRMLNLPTLVHRRERGDMIEVFKHLQVYDPVLLPQHCFLQSSHASRKHNFQIVHQRPLDGTKGVHQNSFYIRTIKTWNNLPANVVNAKTLNQFKNKLDRAWAGKPNKYNFKDS